VSSDAATGVRERLLGGSPVVAIARQVTWDDLVTTAGCLADHRLAAVEVTLDGEDALEQIRRLRAQFGADLVVGAGTVTSSRAASRAVEAGASFLVSPYLDLGVVGWAAREGVAMLPGAITPTEVHQAAAAGAAAVKIFPAGPLGPAYLGAILGPMPDVALVPTGGISPEDAEAWLRAGAAAVGLGSALFAAATDRRGALIEALADRVRAWRR
jgi:2-dehydro-3-deoxyphosphogluconate aldolase/(4S)-4-hydroxy-2-oxoglutarate aldolase